MRKSNDEITEVRCGRTGRGLLVENDGHIITNSDVVKQINEDISNGDKFFIPDHFIVPAVFQKYGIENANKRIYPKEVLVPQVERYIAERVNNRCAIGALDHPSCWKSGTYVLLSNGEWKKIEEIQVGDVVETLTADGRKESHPVERVIATHYAGEMTLMQNGMFDICVTPNHKFPIFNYNGEFVGLIPISDIAKHLIPNQDKCFIPSSQEANTDSALWLNDTVSLDTENFDGMVYCLEVKNHTFYAKCENGQCIWSGNSTSLSGHDVSHNIINLEWDKQTLVGEMELHLSPGFRRHGICSTSGDLVANMLLDDYLIGVSSRGEGNVENKLGKMLVTEFYLLCWDVVLEPSTPNAFIRRERSQLQPYIENANPKVGPTSLNEKLERIRKIKHILNS